MIKIIKRGAIEAVGMFSKSLTCGEETVEVGNFVSLLG